MREPTRRRMPGGVVALDGGDALHTCLGRAVRTGRDLLMGIQITLDAVLERKGMRGKELAARIGVSETYLSLFRSGKVKGVRFSTLAKLCEVLECQPAELLRWEK